MSEGEPALTSPAAKATARDGLAVMKMEEEKEKMKALTGGGGKLVTE